MLLRGKSHPGRTGSAPVVSRPLTVRVARWSATHPWRAIAVWLVFVALCLVTGSIAGTNSATSADYRVGEAGRAEAIAAEGRLTRAPTERVLIESPSGPVDAVAADRAVHDLTRRMLALPEVDRVEPPVRSENGEIVMVSIVMKGEELAAKRHLGPLIEQTAAVQAANPGLRVTETGRPSMSRGLDAQRADDLLRSEMITFPVTLAVLLLVFGSVLAAGVPLLLAVSSIAASMGLAAVASHALPDAGVGNNVILLIGMAVGVDYSLFYLKREREERARAGGRVSPAAAVELAAATSGRAIVVSGLAVIVSTACLYLAADVIFSSLATGTVIAVLVAMVSSLTVLPAVLAKAGDRVERRRARRAVHPASGRRDGGRVWGAVLRPATRHPVATLLAATVAMLALALPAVTLKLNVPGTDTFSRTIPAVRTWDRLTTAFPHVQTTHLVAVRADPARSGEVVTALADLARRVEAGRRSADPVPEPKTSSDRRISTLELAVPFPAGSPEARLSLQRLRSEYLPATVGRVAGAEAAVGGDVARDVDYVAHQNEKLPWVIGFLLVATFVMTVAAFGSVVIAFLGVILNLLSAAAAFGLLVVVFQHTWAEGLLGFTSTGFIGSRVPLFLFVILFGLSMDYQVFAVSRIRESALRGAPTRAAVVEGIGGSAGVITSAAVVMVSVFASFMFLSLVEMKQMGFGLAVAVLLDAFVVRTMILPSIMTLLGEASWWPSRTMRRRRAAPDPADVLPVGAAD
ncbi:MMPL family transporter [Planotetraspora kaengkrachanensis]|uniref:Membrane protein n=1 Tax=Planotetraspora kaengkrachanensis TaxID=575193 RepID=A0A8J3PWW2_9ACTN|nr:MMPL family transporter [Planotetraspora kaengkrachanensis]GIG82575.1 membrane protein [Planotetraspora kaengkrachanensis]